jgi:hypothetical protein
MRMDQYKRPGAIHRLDMDLSETTPADLQHLSRFATRPAETQVF